MIKLSELPDFKLVRNDVDELLPLSHCGEQIQWLSNRITEFFPTEKRLGIIQPTSPTLVLLWLAALKAGKEPCILQYPTEKLSKDYWRDSLQHTIASTGLEGLIHDRVVQGYQPENLSRSLLIVGEIGKAPVVGDVISDGAVVQLSSGTTGYKKGVRLTLEQLRSHAESYNRVMQLGANDTIVSWLPLYHDMGFIACFVMPLLLKVPVVMLDPLAWIKKPASLFAAIRRNRGTICYMPNFGFEVMSRQSPGASLDTMRHWISCSEPTYLPTLEKFCQKTGSKPETVSTCYGMAENVFAVAQSNGLKTVALDGQHVVSCGRAIPGTEIKVIEGELFVKSATSLHAYVGTDDVRDVDGFYATGDLGALVDGEVVILGRKRDVMISAGKKYFLNDLDYAAGQVVPESAGRIAALADFNRDLGTETILFLIERQRFWETLDLAQIVEKLKALTNLESLQAHFVPPFFITKTSSGKINRKKTLQDWKACREFGSSSKLTSGSAESFRERVRTSFSSLPTDQPLGKMLDSLGSVVMRLICEDHGLAYDPEATLDGLAERLNTVPASTAEKVFSVVALVDGIKLGFGTKAGGFITDKFIADLSREVGLPVSVEHVCVPPAPVLLSDLVFHDYFMPRDAGEKYNSFSTVMRKIKNASLVLIDDEDSLRLPDFCAYPQLSHRFNPGADSDLLGHRLTSYTLNHHQIARDVVPGKDIRPEQITPAILAIEAQLGRPVMKLAFHQQFSAFTKDWDYSEYRQYVSDADYQKNPINFARIQTAILQFVRTRKSRLQPTEGAATRQFVLKDPPHFCSFLMNRQAVDYVVERHDSFCIGGLPSSVPYLENRIKAAGKRYFYSNSVNPDRADFDCLVLTGFSGQVKTDKAYFDFMHVGDEGGKPHNVSAKVARECPPLVAGNVEMIRAYCQQTNGLVPIGNWILNHETQIRWSRLAGGTIVLYGPIYSRSGYGVLARSWALAFRQAGLHVRVVPVDCQDGRVADLDDTDSYTLRQLEHTEVRGPVTAIFCYVPIYAWPKMELPKPNVRIMLTTYDCSSNAKSPPYRLVHICNQMDQIWLPNESERRAWIQAGAKAELIRTFNWPSDWIDNPILGSARPKARRVGEPFRFLHVSVFFPRRRIDVLIRAFLEEFKCEGEAELYLKISYPSWHPVPGKPKKDLQALIDNARRDTGSKARITVDESAGTRKELARLYDSCDFYVSSDTNSTAPVSEALLRCRLGIITDGWNVEMPPEMIVVPNSERQITITPEMAVYMPHHKGASFPALEVSDMRKALRQAFAMTPDEHSARALSALQFMRNRFSYANTAPAALKAILEAWDHRNNAGAQNAITVSEVVQPAKPRAAQPRRITFCGLQLFHGKIPKMNRGICRELISRGHEISLHPSNGPFQIDELPLDGDPEFLKLADRFYHPLKGRSEINICSRWHPIFREEQADHQVMINTWWAGSIPVDWLPRIETAVDEVWVPSRHVRDNFLMAGVPEKKLWLLPMGVDTRLFRPEAGTFPLKTRKQFKFLFVGEATPRKGIDVLLQAYFKAFTRRDDVCLVIKDMNCDDYYCKRAIADSIRKFQCAASLPEVEYVDSMPDETNLAALYASCNCFVQPFRAASFPFAALEAMSAGLPVITTGYGGALEFCNSQNSHLLTPREVRRQSDYVGHWRVAGPQRHAEVDVAELVEKLRHVVSHPAHSRALGQTARESVLARFTPEQQAVQIEERMNLICSSQHSTAVSQTLIPTNSVPAKMGDALPWLGINEFHGTVVFFAPFYNRSGYGTGGRAMVAGLRAAGVPVRIVPVDNVEPGIDDCDMAALKALEQTPVRGPVAAIFYHVPNKVWLQVQLPKNSIRIMFTTYDGSAQGNRPPKDWLDILNQMDQIWLNTQVESEVFQAAGIPASKIRLMPCPHPWINNTVLPPVTPTPDAKDNFRFLSMAMFLPRRRWDTLIEAFLAEFANEPRAELYLKVNYPAWHPEPNRPKRDLHEMIRSLREKTGSSARIIVDEDLGTRRDICRIIDSCHAYVSTDTTSTAPLSEALIRGRIAIAPDGYGATLPYSESILIIPVDPACRTPMTAEMLAYQPHHKGKDMPLLKVGDVRRIMRSAFELPGDRRAAMGQYANLFMETNFGPNCAVRLYVRAIHEGLAPFRNASTTGPDAAPNRTGATSVRWEGSFLDFGSLSHVNRAITGSLQKNSGIQIHRINSGEAVGNALLAYREKLSTVAPDNAQITVRHAWPPNWSKPKSGKLAIIQPWEFGALPIEWVKQSANVDEFWVPSEMVRKFYLDSGIDAAKVHVIPNGIDPDVFRPDVAPRRLATNKKFRFLFVGGTIGRKGPDVLLNAYLKSFTAADDVCLVIKDFGGKSVYRGQTFSEQIKQAQQLPNAPEILYLDEELSPEELPGLYAACQCLAHPYRGEGFGLPVLEAMACGLPVIVTGGGATDDFATDEFAYRLPSTRRGIGNEVGGMKTVSEAWLLEPDAHALGERMRWIVANPAAARERGIAASKHARHNWTWRRAADHAAKRLEMLAKTGTTRAATSSAKAAPLPPPACAKLGGLTKAREQFGRKEFSTAWASALAAIKTRPFHPEGFGLLAEIALAVGDAKTAQICAQRAHDFAPAWSKGKQIVKKAGAAKQSPTDGALAALMAKDASRITHHASRISVCLIVKNEEKFLEQCLKSVRNLAHQIVVVDTGSTDRTVEIAKEHGAEVHSFAWSEDFSAARNAALEHATGDWVLMLDADEELPVDQHAHLLADVKKTGVIAHRLPLVNRGQEADGRSFVPRLFRNAPGVFFHGRIHEQVFPSLVALGKNWGLGTALGTAQIVHHGYSKELVKDRNKIERNLALLRKAIDEDPTDSNLVMNLGLELVRSGDLQNGIAQYREAFGLMSNLLPGTAAVSAACSDNGDRSETRRRDAGGPRGEIVPELREVLLSQFTSQLYKVREHDEVVRVLTSPLAKHGGLTATLHFALGLSCFELKNYREAVEQMRQCLSKRDQPSLSPINTDIHTAAPQHCIALSLARLGDIAGAEKAFQAALAETGRTEEVRLDYSKFLAQQNRQVDALHSLHEVVALNSSNAAAWRMGGEIALSKPEFFEFAGDWTGEALKHLSDDMTIVAQRAEALLLSGDTTSARDLWQRIVKTDSQPRAVAALILCEFLASEAATVPDAAHEPAVSREFLLWYQKLIAAQANKLVKQINERLEALCRVLPRAAGVLEKALVEAEQTEPAGAVC